MQTLFVYSIEAHVISLKALRTFWFGRTTENGQYRYFGPAAAPELVERTVRDTYEKVRIVRRRPVEDKEEIFARIELMGLAGGANRVLRNTKLPVPSVTDREIAVKYVRHPV